MKDRITFYLLTFLTLSVVFTLPACIRCPQLKKRVSTDKTRVSTDKAQSLWFKDKTTGRSIEIGMYGSVLSLCCMRPMREGYAFAYHVPQSPGKVKVAYYAGNKHSFGLKPISLTSNVPAGEVEHGQEVTITAVVATDDGLFQSTHEFRWAAGNDDLVVTRNIKKMVSDAAPPRWFNVMLTLKAKKFSRSEDKVTILAETCPPQPEDSKYPKEGPICLKVSQPVAWAMDKARNSAKCLRGELSRDNYPLPKKAGKYDVVFGLKGDSPMSPTLKDQSMTLNYVYGLEPKVSK